jgi:hypothetical protein
MLRTSAVPTNVRSTFEERCAPTNVPSDAARPPAARLNGPKRTSSELPLSSTAARANKWRTFDRCAPPNVRSTDPCFATSPLRAILSNQCFSAALADATSLCCATAALADATSSIRSGTCGAKHRRLPQIE